MAEHHVYNMAESQSLIQECGRIVQESCGLDIPGQPGDCIEEQDHQQEPLTCKGVMFDRTLYPWQSGDLCIHIIPKDSYDKKISEVEAMERIQFNSRPKEFRRMLGSENGNRAAIAENIQDAESEVFMWEVRLREYVKIDVIFIQWHPDRRVLFTTKNELTRRDILSAQAHLRLTNASASMGFTVQDETCHHTQERRLRMIIKTDMETVVKEFVVRFNRSTHRYADVRNATMPKDDKKLLEILYIFLLDNISNPFDLSRRLLSKEVLTLDDVEEIDAISVTKNKIDEILKKILRMGNVLDAFIGALYDMDSNERVAIYISNQRKPHLCGNFR